jgi:hypothetical protein
MSVTKHGSELLVLSLLTATATACAVIEPAHDTEITPLWRKAPTEEARGLWVDDVQH